MKLTGLFSHISTYKMHSQNFYPGGLRLGQFRDHPIIRREQMYSTNPHTRTHTHSYTDKQCQRNKSTATRPPGTSGRHHNPMGKHENASRFVQTDQNHPILSGSWPLTPSVQIWEHLTIGDHGEVN